MANPTETLTVLSQKAFRWVQLAAGVLSFALLVLTAFCYHFRPDAWAAVTVFPPWVWPLPGLLMLWLARNPKRKRILAAVAVLWLLFIVIFAEEPKSLLRLQDWPSPEWVAAKQSGKALRVLSLNCASNRDAAAEVARYDPDIVLLQETPQRAEVESLARRLWSDAGVAWGIDTSVIAHGHVEGKALPSSRFGVTTTHAYVRLTSGLEMEVLSVRLVPPVARLDLFWPEAWTAYRDNRQSRRREMIAIADYIESLSPTMPLIVGGDFNAPAGDAVFSLLQPRLHDTFMEGGMGWGNTALNSFAVVRIDQVWVSEQFRALAVVARETKHSDHRIVIADLILQDS